MTYELDPATVDRDGALREAAASVHGDTRLAFLRKAGLGVGAIMGGGAVLSALTPSAFAASGSGRPPASFGAGDIGILNYALTLEYLEMNFYAQGVKNIHFKDPHLKALATRSPKTRRRTSHSSRARSARRRSRSRSSTSATR